MERSECHYSSEDGASFGSRCMDTSLPFLPSLFFPHLRSIHDQALLSLGQNQGQVRDGLG